MSTTTHRTEDPALETAELGAVYSIHAPHAGDPWVLYKIADDCGVDTPEPLDVPDGWDDADEHIRPRITRLARDADLARTNLEIAIVTDPTGPRSTRPHPQRGGWGFVVVVRLLRKGGGG